MFTIVSVGNADVSSSDQEDHAIFLIVRPLKNVPYFTFGREGIDDIFSRLSSGIYNFVKKLVPQRNESVDFSQYFLDIDIATRRTHNERNFLSNSTISHEQLIKKNGGDSPLIDADVCPSLPADYVRVLTYAEIDPVIVVSEQRPSRIGHCVFMFVKNFGKRDSYSVLRYMDSIGYGPAEDEDAKGTFIHEVKGECHPEVLPNAFSNGLEELKKLRLSGIRLTPPNMKFEDVRQIWENLVKTAKEEKCEQSYFVRGNNCCSFVLGIIKKFFNSKLEASCKFLEKLNMRFGMDKCRAL